MGLEPPPAFTIPPNAEQTRKFKPIVKARGDVLIWLAKTNGWTRGVELGTGEGKTAVRLLSRALKLHLTTVDLWEAQPDNPGPENWMGWPHEIHERAARSRLACYGRRCKILKEYSVAAADRFEAESLDFVFIDADHSEMGVRSDIYAWTPKIRRGGMILGHDINWPTVKRAVDDLCPGYWVGPDNVWGRDVE